MRFIFLLLLFPILGIAQFDTTKFYRSPNYGDLFRRAKINQLMLPNDTTTNKVGVAQIGQRLFLYNVNKWVEVGNFDSTGLSNRINLKLNISDTASMLLAYKHWLQGYLKGNREVKLSRGDDTGLLRESSLSGEQRIQIKKSHCKWLFFIDKRYKE